MTPRERRQVNFMGLALIAVSLLTGYLFCLATSYQPASAPPPGYTASYDSTLTARWVRRGWRVHYALLDGPAADGLAVADLLAAFTDAHPEVDIRAWQTYPVTAGSAVLVIVTD